MLNEKQGQVAFQFDYVQKIWDDIIWLLTVSLRLDSTISASTRQTVLNTLASGLLRAKYIDK